MRRGAILIPFLVIGAWLTFGPRVPGDDTTEPARPFGMTRRVPWTSSRLVGSPDPPRPYRLDRVFPKIKFQGPVCLAQEPDTNRLIVAENKGKIFSFPIDNPNAEKPELFLDMKRSVYAISFHPHYKENGYVFVFSPDPPDGTQGKLLSRVSRFQTNLEGPRVVRPDSEQVIIEWPSGGHNGGEAIFGPDGFLYICTGDGTTGSDVNNSGQGVDDLLSVMIRIDVDHPDPGRSYSIPKDNPFIDYPGARPEVWAHGFRNPWRMSFDSETGRLWVGDVGQDLWEMIRVVKKGGNYGWSVQEGSHPFHPHKKVGPGPIEPPVVEHHHTECRSITGGYVYHGTKFPELRGVYIYGDYQYGKIWGLRYDGEKVTWHEELADTPVNIASFTVSREGDIYAIDNSTGFIHTLAHTPPGSATAAFPRKLSETGLYASVQNRQMAPGVIPYSVNAPSWSDGAHQERFLALPGESQFVDAKSWKCPDGAVLVQTLSMDLEPGKAESRTPIETRILVKQDEHWMGYTYLWNDTLSDATLVGATGTERLLTIKDASAPGGTRQQTWHVPGRNECMFCHSRAAGFALSLNTEQLNRDHDYGGVVDNQIRAMAHIGLFQKPPESAPDSLPRLVDAYDPNADLEQRARSYLHVNCSICHVVDGGGNSFIELARGKSLAETKAIDGKPVQGTFGITEARVIAPGEPERSVLYYRVGSLGGARMPRVGSHVVDERALEMFHEWIARMPPADSAQAAKAKERGKQHDDLLAVLRDAAPSKIDARKAAIHDLTASTTGALVLARALAQESSASSVRAEILAITKDHPNVEVRDLFERFLPESERTRRLGDTIDPQEILALTGDAGRGRGVFAAESVVNCKSCHQLDGVGVPIGPDLSKIGAKYPRPELLQQILEPSRAIDPKFTLYRLDTTDGQVYTGLLLERSEKEIVLRDSENRLRRVAVTEVEQFTPQKQSLMPERLLQSLTAQQAADLLAYLASKK